MLRFTYTIILFVRDFIPLLKSVPSWRLPIIRDMIEQAVFLLSASLLIATLESEQLNFSMLRALRLPPC